MYYYGQQPDIAAKIAQMVEDRRTDLEEKALVNGRVPDPFTPWSEASKARSKLWSELSRAEQKIWTQRSKEAPVEKDK